MNLRLLTVLLTATMLTQPLGGVLVVLLAFAAALAGAPLDGRGRWPKVLRWLGVQAAFGVAAVVNLHRVTCFA